MSNRLTEKQRIIKIKKNLEHRVEFRYNVVLGKLEHKFKDQKYFIELTDYELNTIARELKESNIPCSPAQLNDILRSDLSPKYDPFEEYFLNLPDWDGKDHIKALADTINTTSQELWYSCFIKWFVAMVGSLINPGIYNHTVLILIGKQGIGKTTWIFKLIPKKLESYFYTGAIRLGNKDTEVMLSESMIINLEELSQLSTKELNELKELITKPTVRLRRPYGRFHENLIRRASFTGSTNDPEFLTDTTGNRRFLPFIAKDIKYEHNINLDQVYAQAMALFKDGYKYYFEPKEIENINKYNERFRLKSIEEEYLLQLFSKCETEDKTDVLTPTEILNEFHSKFGIKVTTQTKQRLGKALQANGFKKVSRNGKKPYILKRN